MNSIPWLALPPVRWNWGEPRMRSMGMFGKGEKDWDIEGIDKVDKAAREK